MTAAETRIFVGAGAGFPGARAARRGLFRHTARRDGWEALSAGLPKDAAVHAIVIHPNDPNVVFIGTEDGPYRSIDGGDHWRRVDFPDRGAAIWSLAFDPTRPNIMYAGAAPVALYRSRDGGVSWRRLAGATSPAHCERAGFDTRVLRITVDPGRPDDVYVALEVGGVLRSADGGETWSDMSAALIELADQPHLQSNVGGRHCRHCEGMLDCHAIAISAAAPGSVFLAVRMGLFRSNDHGASWRDSEIGRFAPFTYCHDVVVSPHDPEVLYACLSPSAISGDGQLHRSDDLGRSWRRMDHHVEIRSTLMAVGAHPRDPAQLHGVTMGGQVLSTYDAGETWHERPLPEGVEDVHAIACG